MSSSYRNSLNEWLSQLDVSASKVLDIGGSQNPIKGQTKSWDVKEYLIADLPNPHKDSPKPDIELDLNWLPPWQPQPHDEFYILKESEKYDLIFCLEVFDYVFNTLQAFETIKDLLKDGGTAWVTFPSVYPNHQPVEDDALRYFPGGIKKLAEAVGLTVEEMIPRRFETNMWEQTYRTERMRAAKGVDHNFSGWIVRFSK